MAKLGEGVSNAVWAAADSVGISGLKCGWDTVRERHHRLRSVPVAAGVGLAIGGETFAFPNSLRDFLIEDNIAVSEHQKTEKAITASMLWDALGLAGTAGVGLLTNSLEAAFVAKVALNALTSFAVRTQDSIQRRRSVTA